MKRKSHVNREAAGRGREAPRLWLQPGVWVFAVALVPAAAGLALVIRAIDDRPVTKAQIGGLSMRLGEARWLLDQMDHGENFQKPSTMMPDMPEWGKQRVSLDLTFVNDSERVQMFRGEEFVLVPDTGEELAPMGAQVGMAPLAPGQTLNNVVHFDLDTTEAHGRLRVEWRRGGDKAVLAIPAPADHYHLRPRGGEVALPRDARLLLPIGVADRGEGLYKARYGCIACHGDPERPGSANVGPHLRAIATHAPTRIPGTSGAQYIYDSIIEPGAFIAPECQDRLPCLEPTEMPEYASLVSLQDAADLLAYLLAQHQVLPTDEN